MLRLIGNDDSETADTDGQKTNIDKIGTILVKVFRLSVRKRSRPWPKTARKTTNTTNTFRGHTFEGLQALSERELKGKALSTLQSNYFPQALVRKILLANLHASALGQANPFILERMVALGMILG